MKQAQMIGLAVAGVCGLGAFVGMKTLVKPKVEIRPESNANTVKVLVARSDIQLGTLTNDASFRWQEYPDTAVPQGAVRCDGGACPMREYSGGIARAPIMKEEIITRSKLVRSGEGGVLASILPQGMRAISTKITEDSAVGKLILPNDHVDVILIRRMRTKGQEEHVSDTLFKNVKVLAIGQKIQGTDGAKTSEGNTATLELSPRQTEMLALAKSMGEISLALRSIADFKEDKGETELKSEKAEDRGNAIRMLKYGVRSRSYGVN